MNPRVEGVFEAVSYLREFVTRYRDRERFLSMLENELDSIIGDISSGTAVDFRSRLRLNQ